MQTGRCCKCTCTGKWTPNDENDRTITISDCAVKLTNNPLMDKLGTDIAIMIESLPSGQLPLAGGAYYFGHTSGDGIGYYGINNQAVCLTRYTEWDVRIESLRLFDSLVDEIYPYDGVGTSSSPELFTFAANSKPPSCIWDNVVTNTVVYDSVTVGTEPEDTDVTITYSDCPYSYSDFYVDKVKRFDVPVLFSHYGYTVWTLFVYYNSNIGYAPKAILDIPKDEMYRPSGMTANVCPISYSTQANGVSVDDPAMTAGPSPVYTQFSHRPYLKPGTSGSVSSSSRYEMGRTAISSFILGNRIAFDNGNWVVYPTLEFRSSAMERHTLNFVTPITGYSQSIGSTAIYPIVTSARVGTPQFISLSAGGFTIFEADLSDFETPDDTQGVYVLFHNPPRNITEYPEELQTDGGEIDIDRITTGDLMVESGLPVSLYRSGLFYLPDYLGTETVTYPLTALTTSSTSPAVYNQFSTCIQTGQGAGYTAEVTEEQERAFRDVPDPIDIALLADDPKTTTASESGVQWNVIDGWGMVIFTTSPLVCEITTEAEDGATLHRELIP